MKRSEHFQSFNSKRPKLQQAVDDIWGDDPEIDEIDRCINLATQICSQNTQHNTLNLTSYDDFKRRNINSSTQAFVTSAIPSTSGVVPKKENNLNSSIISIQSSDAVKDNSDEEVKKLLQKVQILETEKKKLTEMYETKNGEITILRSKLTQAQKTIDSEKMDKLRTLQENQQQWDTKCNTVNKEVNSLKCELNLKNLENANLREKLTELKKVCNSNLNMSIVNDELNMSQIVNRKNKVSEPKKSTESKNIQTECNDFSYPVSSVPHYPLQILIPQSVFEKCQEKNTVLKIKNIKGKNSLTPYRHNFTTTLIRGSNDQNVCKTGENKLICLDNLFPDIHKLLQCSEEELDNSVDVNTFVQNILNVTKNSLVWLSNQLNKIYEKLSYDDIENMDNIYLENNQINYQSDCIFSGILWHENETAVDIRRHIAILSALVIPCKMLHNYFITQSNELNINNINGMQMEIEGQPQYEFLNILLEIGTTIKNIRRSEEFCGFLSAVLKLLANLSTIQILPTDCYEIIYKIFKQTILSRPSKPVLKYVCEFVKYFSSHHLFVSKLCTMKKSDITQSSSKEGIIFFSEDSCAFQILLTELETCELSSEMSLNVIQFLMNSLTCNVPWMYPQDEQRCECLMGVYSLGITILYNTQETHSQIGEHIQDKSKHLHHAIFRIGLLFLDSLTARIPDLVVRCSRFISQYQAIIKYINKIQKSLFLLETHESALESLVSQLNCDVQKTSKKKNIDFKNKNIDYIFNSCFKLHD